MTEPWKSTILHHIRSPLFVVTELSVPFPSPAVALVLFLLDPTQPDLAL